MLLLCSITGPVVHTYWIFTQPNVTVSHICPELHCYYIINALALGNSVLLTQVTQQTNKETNDALPEI